MPHNGQMTQNGSTPEAGQPASRRLIWMLAALAGAMELFYLFILRLSNLKEQVETFLPLILLVGILYLVSVYLSEKISPRRSLLVFIFVAAAVFRLTLLPLYPSLSDDLYRYRWEGKVQQAGYNPYLVRPSDPDLAFLRDETYPAIPGRDFATVYGPLLEELYWLSFLLTDWVILLKLPYLFFDLGVVLLLFRLLPTLGVSPLRAIVYAWSPLTVVMFGASGHNDSLPVFAVVLALLWYQKGQGKLSMAGVAASALSKLYAVFLLPVFLFRTSWKFIWVPVLAAAVAFAPYAGAWRHLGDDLAGYTENWRNNDSLYALIWEFTGSATVGWRIYLSIVAAVILYAVMRKLRPERASFLILGAVLLVSPNCFPWYVTWIVPLLAIYPNPAWLLLTVTTFLFYHVLIPYRTLGLWEEETFFRLLEYIPFYVLLIGGAIVGKYRANTQP
ncbi:MAG: hypothetical protein O7A06_14765 [Acidobacteria bacterium]|nr:hypothetical protein [Acidobacteriota bacterium]MCZ6752890.1 hypothetical protein [Acidobacteriota bacterium]